MGTSPKPGMEASVSGEALAPFLKLTDASVRRAGRIILHVDHLEIAEGENIAILGPNGSGKSTFVKLITREVMPLYRDVPPVLFRGNPRATLVDVRRALGIVSSTMQSEITVHLPAVDIVAGGLTGTVGLPLRISESAAANARRRAREALDQVGIADLADQDVMTMSTGQARRILIARSLVHGPDALMFDEPCTGLDPQGMYYVRKTLRMLTQAGKSIVMVTHYPEDIIPEITRLILIKDGKIFADGPKEELLDSKAISNLFDVPVKINCEQGYYSLVSPY